MPKVTTIAVSTSGGDAPGLNAAIRGVTACAHARGWRVVGVCDGLDGLLLPDDYPDGGLVNLTPENTRDIADKGGTILGAANDGSPSMERVGQLPDVFAHHGIDALVAVGGDGTQAIAYAAHMQGIRVIGAPKTIDNDLEGTAQTFGFDTAVNVVTDALRSIRDTADAHRRVMLVEVMGRDAGWIALYSGVAAGADAIVLPEFPYDKRGLLTSIREALQAGRRSVVVVVAEGARLADGSVVSAPRDTGGIRLGGVAQHIANDIQGRVDRHVRVAQLGYIQRGGTPTAFDRVLAQMLGAAAVDRLSAGDTGVMVGWDGKAVITTPLVDVAGRIRTVPYDDPVLHTARQLGIYTGA